jgi:hypothetical protein
LVWLRSQGINDPNVDVFYGVIIEDMEILKKGLEKGADPSVTKAQILSKYEQLIREQYLKS